MDEIVDPRAEAIRVKLLRVDGVVKDGRERECQVFTLRVFVRLSTSSGDGRCPLPLLAHRGEGLLAQRGRTARPKGKDCSPKGEELLAQR